MKALDLTGQRFGSWTVIEQVPNKNKKRYYLCKCDCGKESEVKAGSLMQGQSSKCLSCSSREKNVKHGLSKSPEYKIWLGMLNRCRNNHKHYENVDVCEEWNKSFEAFLRDVGKRPSPKHSIDRINVYGNYEPSNCRWVYKDELGVSLQGNNKTNNKLIEFGGFIATMAEWCAITDLTYSCLCRRLLNGWDIKRALTTPKQIQIHKKGAL